MLHTSKADILLVLGHILHVRNYVASGLLTSLIDSGLNVSVVAPGNTFSATRRIVPQLNHLYSFDHMRMKSHRQKLLHLLRLGSMVSRRDQAEYRWKVKRAARGDLVRAATIALWLAIDAVGDAEKVAYSLVRRLRANLDTYRLLQAVNPSLIVWPTTISNPADFDLVKAAQDLGIPVLMCEGSWDNFTTKAAVWPRPQRVLTWGEYSRQQAIRHHGFTDDTVVVTGPPHFDIYGDPEALMERERWFADHGLNPGKRLILFGGTTVGKFSEEAYIIRLLSSWIDTGTLPPSYIWYRPHPRARSRAAQEGISSMPHVIIDPGVSGSEFEAGDNWSVHPEDAIQRANALASCDVILSAFSTIIIEGALLGKPSIIIGFAESDGSRPPIIYPNLEFGHVKYLLRSPWIESATKNRELYTNLQRFLAVNPDTYCSELREFGLTVADCSGGQGRQRTIKAIEDMFRQVSG